MSAGTDATAATDPPATGTRPATADRAPAAAAWIVWIVAMAASLAGVILGIQAYASPQRLLGQTILSALSSTLITVSYGSVGLLLRLRRPQIVIGWLLLGIGLVAGLSNLIWGYFWLGVVDGPPPGQVPIETAAMVSSAVLTPAWVLLLFLLVLLFPDGHLASPSWRPVAWFAVATTVFLGIAVALAPGRVLLFQVIDNPLAPTGPIGALARWGPPVGVVLVTVMGTLALWSTVVRYRGSAESERRQLKWLAWGSSIAVASGVVFFISEGWAYDPANRVAELVWVVFAVGSSALPIAVVIAILRERLYDIDRLISRTFVYGLLTAILAGLYSALIRLFNALFVGMTGETSEVALVLTTLILATTFTPIKQRLEHIAAGRFGTPADEPAAGGPTGAAGGSAATGAADADASVAMSTDELDRRMEAIARRVGRELLAERDARGAAGHAATSRPVQPSHGEPDDVGEPTET